MVFGKIVIRHHVIGKRWEFHRKKVVESLIHVFVESVRSKNPTKKFAIYAIRGGGILLESIHIY